MYLPQFHPIPENDLWWGKGFTEWTNVTKAKPLFKGHYQPHLPADLGFYDLRLSESRQTQADLAREYGIHGFCYYYYWFEGKKLLEQPIEAMIETGKPDFPFMLCWANQTWTKRWDGRDKDVLIHQGYSHDDDLIHIKQLCRYFNHPNYIRIDGKPFFIIYRPHDFPNIKKTIEVWREEAKKYGIGELYLAYMHYPGIDVNTFMLGFDAAVEFSVLGNRPPARDFNKKKNKIACYIKSIFKSIEVYNHSKTLVYTDYSDFIKNYFIQEKLPCKLYPSLFPGWDNTARVGQRAHIVLNNTPDLYESWLRMILNQFEPYSAEENFVFINAWNEWAEGNHLEPDQKWGKAFLSATKKVLDEVL